MPVSQLTHTTLNSWDESSVLVSYDVVILQWVKLEAIIGPTVLDIVPSEGREIISIFASFLTIMCDSQCPGWTDDEPRAAIVTVIVLLNTK